MDSPLQGWRSPSSFDDPASNDPKFLLAISRALKGLLQHPIYFQPPKHLETANSEELDSQNTLKLAPEAPKNALNNVTGEKTVDDSEAKFAIESTNASQEESANESMNEAINESVNDSENESAITDESANDATNESTDGGTDGSAYYSATSGTSNSIDESANSSVDGTTSEATKESPNKATTEATKMGTKEFSYDCKADTKSISSQWERQNPRARGIDNLVNRCYQNSILQAVFHIPKIVNWMERAHVKPCQRRCVLCVLRLLCSQYWGLPGLKNLLKHGFLERSLKMTRAFNGWIFDEQNDAYLFLLHLLATIPESNPSLTDITNSLLGYTTLTIRVCSHCKHKSSRGTFGEKEHILQIAWDQETTLDQVLSDREFNNVYDNLRCDACKSNTRHTYQKRLCHAPDVLIIQLTRFQRNETGDGFRKKTLLLKRVTNEKPSSQERITLTETLDLTTFSISGKPLSYTLQAVVHHWGSLNSGHYVTDAKGPHDLWERIDERKVSPSTIEQALDPSPLSRKARKKLEDPWTPYLLFYCKVEVKEGLDQDPSESGEDSVEIKEGSSESEEDSRVSKEEVQGQKVTPEIKIEPEEPKQAIWTIKAKEPSEEPTSEQGLDPNHGLNFLVQAIKKTSEEEMSEQEEMKRQELEPKRNASTPAETMSGAKKIKLGSPWQVVGKGGKAIKGSGKKNKKGKKTRR